MSNHTKYLEITNPEDLLQIETDLKLMLDSDFSGDSSRKVTVQFTLSLETVIGMVGWMYTFWIFGKTFFFPEGKFRMPKFIEFKRNWQIVTGVLALKNTFVGLWKDRKATLDEIGSMLQKLIPQNQRKT